MVVPTTEEDSMVRTASDRGDLAPVGECAYCDKVRETNDMMAPGHTVRERCESGKRPHCTCDRCY